MEFFVPFIVAVAAILIAPLLFKKLGVPSVVAILLVGIVFGPYGLDIIGYIIRLEGADEDKVMFTFSTLGLLGAVFLMSLAGMEISPKLIKKEWKNIVLFATLSAAIPAIAGYIIGMYIGLSSLHATFLASLFASHSVALVFTTIKEVRLIGTRLGVIILKSTVFTDLISLIMISIVIQIAVQKENIGFENPVYFLKYLHLQLDIWHLVFVSILTTIAFIYLSILFMRYLAHHTFRKFSAKDPRRLTGVFLLIIIIAFFGEVIGLHVIIGAYIAGLAIADSWGMKEEGRILHHRLNTLGYGIFVPMFFFVLGMNTNIMLVFEAPEYMGFVIITAIGLIGTKIFSGYLALRIIGFNHRESFFGSWVTIPQLSATLVAAKIGKESGIIPGYVFATIIIISIGTTILRPMGSKALKHILKIKIPYIDEEIKDFVYSLDLRPSKDERTLLYEGVIEIPIIETNLEGEELEETFVGEEMILEPTEKEGMDIDLGERVL